MEWQHYNRKNEFELCFDQIWLELEKKGLVKNKEFQTVLNLSQYKFSPYMSLTKAQVEALTSIVHTIDSNETQPHRKNFLPRPILVSGDPGTGKTVVATSLLHYLKTNEKYKNLKIALVYPINSTKEEIQEMVKTVEGLSKKDVISPIGATKEKYDIVICDEAQRLRRPKNAGMFYTSKIKKVNEKMNINKECDELDWLLKNSKCQILFYDEKQNTSPADIPKESFEERLYARYRGIRPITLNEQMRIRAGREYVPYIYDILFQRNPTPKQFENYEFKLFQSFTKMFNKMKAKEKQVGLCRLCSSYAWKWISKDNPNIPDIKIEDIDIWWNQKRKGWLKNPTAKEEMGSIYTLAGLDLNYAVVVIGPDVYYDSLEEKIKIDRTNLFDNNVKRNTPDEKLKEYILKTYAVLMTRGIMGTYIYACDENLRNYLCKYIPLV